MRQQGSRSRSQANAKTTMDSPAWANLMQEHLPPIYRFLYSMLGNREEAEEMTTRVFVLASHTSEERAASEPIRARLMRIAHDVVADHWSGKGGEQGPHETPPVSRIQALAALWSANRERGNVWTHYVLSALTVQERDLITQRFLLDLPLLEIAERMGLTMADALRLQYRALQHAAEVVEHGAYRRSPAECAVCDAPAPRSASA